MVTLCRNILSTDSYLNCNCLGNILMVMKFTVVMMVLLHEAEISSKTWIVQGINIMNHYCVVIVVRHCHYPLFHLKKENGNWNGLCTIPP